MPTPSAAPKQRRLTPAVVALAALISFAGCSGSPSVAETPGTQTPATSQPAAPTPSPTPTPTPTPTPDPAQPKTLKAATAAAQENSDRFSSGDFAGAWLLFSKKLRTQLSQKDFVKLSTTCNSTGIPITVTGVRMDGDSKAIVRLEVMGFKQSRTMVYEDGGWYMDPSPQLAKQLGKPVAEIIKAYKKDGSCNA